MNGYIDATMSFVSIYHSLQDMLLADITSEELLKIAERLGVDYLGPAAEFPSSFPVDGKIQE
jgi:hypothetical protein